MGLYSRKDFAKKCGVTPIYLNIYISRKKVILTGKNVDDTLPMNIDFYKSRIDNKKKTGNSDFKNNPPPPSEEHEISLTNYNIDRQIKEAELEKKNQEIEKLRLGNNKLRGESIPTDLVRSVITLQAEGSKVCFLDAVEKLIVIISQKKKLTNGEVAEIRGELTGVINQSIDDIVVESRRGVKRIVREYSEIRNRGEGK